MYSFVMIIRPKIIRNPVKQKKKPEQADPTKEGDEMDDSLEVDELKPKQEQQDELITRELGASLFSFMTLFYVASVGTSFAGLFVSPLFYVFHLLDVVNCVDMIRYVISAIRRSGIIILWILIIVVIVSYCFGVIALLFFRSSFDPNNGLYCTTLYECSISVWWSGIVALLYPNMLPNKQENHFWRAVQIAIFQVAFYIIVTVLLLGAVLFGSVVDNFSKLRRAKVSWLDYQYNRLFF